MREQLIKVEYKIEKVKDQPKVWMIVRYSESKRGFNIGKVFEGSRQECKDELEKIKKRKTRRR